MSAGAGAGAGAGTKAQCGAVQSTSVSRYVPTGTRTSSSSALVAQSGR